MGKNLERFRLETGTILARNGNDSGRIGNDSGKNRRKFERANMC